MAKSELEYRKTWEELVVDRMSSDRVPERS
jgi:hypothetical protein